jgi:hypothetical protein
MNTQRIEEIASDLGTRVFSYLDNEFGIATDDAGLAQAMVEQQLRRFLKAQYGPGAWEGPDGGVFTHSYIASKIRRFDQRVDALNWLTTNHDLDNPVMVAGVMYHPVNRERTDETNKLLNEVLDKVL